MELAGDDWCVCVTVGVNGLDLIGALVCVCTCVCACVCGSVRVCVFVSVCVLALRGRFRIWLSGGDKRLVCCYRRLAAESGGGKFLGSALGCFMRRGDLLGCCGLAPA